MVLVEPEILLDDCFELVEMKTTWYYYLLDLDKYSTNGMGHQLNCDDMMNKLHLIENGNST